MKRFAPAKNINTTMKSVLSNHEELQRKFQRWASKITQGRKNHLSSLADACSRTGTMEKKSNGASTNVRKVLARTEPSPGVLQEKQTQKRRNNSTLNSLAVSFVTIGFVWSKGEQFHHHWSLSRPDPRSIPRLPTMCQLAALIDILQLFFRTYCRHLDNICRV